MAKTVINLTDPISALVTKSNTISSHLGDISQLNVGGSNDSDIVQAVNYINEIVQKNDSAETIILINATVDSAYVQARELSPINLIDSSYVKAFFQKDSANGIGFDSAQGRFFIPTATVNTSMIEIDAITGVLVVDSAINSNHLVNGLIDTVHISDAQIITSKIADSSVTEDKMANDAISSAELKGVVTLNIYNAAGSVVKTLYGAGS